jgi:hypothetical protein
MPDVGIKRVIIPHSELPPLDSDTESYNVRYRIVSDDKNRTSHWSQINIIEVNPFSEVDGDLIILSNTIQAVWGDENSRPKYDVFVSFDGNDFIYHGTSAVHSYSFLNLATATIRVAVQVESSKKEYKESLVIYDSGTESLGS